MTDLKTKFENSRPNSQENELVDELNKGEDIDLVKFTEDLAEWG